MRLLITMITLAFLILVHLGHRDALRVRLELALLVVLPEKLVNAELVARPLPGVPGLVVLGHGGGGGGGGRVVTAQQRGQSGGCCQLVVGRWSGWSL